MRALFAVGLVALPLGGCALPEFASTTGFRWNLEIDRPSTVCARALVHRERQDGMGVLPIGAGLGAGGVATLGFAPGPVPTAPAPCTLDDVCAMLRQVLARLPAQQKGPERCLPPGP